MAMRMVASGLVEGPVLITITAIARGRTARFAGLTFKYNSYISINGFSFHFLYLRALPVPAR